jgi:hypothetical protein
MLFADPRAWTKSAVGTWWRFAFVAIMLSGLFVAAVFIAAESGLRSGLSAVVGPIVFQIFVLYALRRMYRQSTGVEDVKSAV